MDVQKLFDAMSDACRQTRSQYHLTLGNMIEILRDQPKDRLVRVSGTLYPCKARSYRGYYSDLAFEITSDRITCEEFLKECDSALGKTFEGFKGGDFIMGKDTPLWISEYGVSSGIAVVGSGIIDNELVLMTKKVD